AASNQRYGSGISSPCRTSVTSRRSVSGGVSIALTRSSAVKIPWCRLFHEFEVIVAVRHRTDERPLLASLVAIPMHCARRDQQRIAGAHDVFFVVDTGHILAFENVLFVFDLVGVLRHFAAGREREPPNGEVRRTVRVVDQDAFFESVGGVHCFIFFLAFPSDDRRWGRGVAHRRSYDRRWLKSSARGTV